MYIKKEFEIFTKGSDTETSVSGYIQGMVDEMSYHFPEVSGAIMHEAGVCHVSNKESISIEFTFEKNTEYSEDLKQYVPKDDAVDYRLDIIEESNGGVSFGYTTFKSVGTMSRPEWKILGKEKPNWSERNKNFKNNYEFVKYLRELIIKEIKYMREFDFTRCKEE